MSEIYKRNCNFCGKYYEGRGKKYCSYECSNKLKNENRKFTKNHKNKLSKVAKEQVNKGIRKNIFVNGHKSWKIKIGKHKQVTIKGEKIQRSHLVWFKNNGKKVPKGYMIHHKDFNSENDDFGNLQLMTYKEHINLHKNIGGLSHDK